jgi:hypothetical protein
MTNDLDELMQRVDTVELLDLLTEIIEEIKLRLMNEAD